MPGYRTRTETDAPRTDAGDPFASGLPREVVLRLLTGRFASQDLRLYWDSEHFKRLRTAVLVAYGSCCLCGCRDPERLTAHHRHYRTLFREDVWTDVSCLCAKCHQKHHRR